MPDILNPTNPNIQFFLSIDKSTVIGSPVSSVVFNGANRRTAGVLLSGILFNAGEMINFGMLTTASEVTFNLNNLGSDHHRVIVKINAYTACTGGEIKTLTLAVAGTSRTETPGTSASLYESALIVHTSNTLSIKVAFGTLG